MRVLFFGTPSFALPSLEALVSSGRFDLRLVVTQPDRPGGRGRRLVPPPVKGYALRQGLPVLQPERLSQVRAAIEAEPVDAACVVAFGQKIPRWLLRHPRWGCINVHPSLLPRWRGAAPVAAALLAGDTRTGVTTMQLDEGWDTGPILLQKEVEILPGETRGELEERLAQLGAGLLLRTLDGLAAGQIAPRPQPEEGACYAPRVDPAAGELDFTRPAVELARQVQAYWPDPAAFTFIEGERVRIARARARVAEGTETTAVRQPGDSEVGPPGSVVRSDGELWVATGTGELIIEQLQPAGKRVMAAAEYLRGHPLTPGTQLGRDPRRS